MTRGDLTATAWRKSKTLSQLSAMVVNVSAVACFNLPGLSVLFSSALMVMKLYSSLSSTFLVLLFFCSLCDGASENLQEIADV